MKRHKDIYLSLKVLYWKALLLAGKQLVFAVLVAGILPGLPTHQWPVPL
jgi:hypothetical protein